MSAYDQSILAADVEDRFPDPVASTVIQEAVKQSAALSSFRTVRMSARTDRLPVLQALPVAYFVDGDTGLKKTTDATWDKVTLIAEEIAVIVPIPEAVLDDSNFDVWGEVTPLVAQAIGHVADQAILFGVNDPASWGGYSDVVGLTITSGNHYEYGTNAASAGGLSEDLNQTIALVEDGGFVPNHIVATPTFKARIRGARDGQGHRFYDAGTASLEGLPVTYTMNGDSWSTKLALVGDFTKGIVGIRQDLTYKISTDGVITDDMGAIVYNLFQQDMVAMRVVFRLAFALANPVTMEGSAGFPFALLTNNT